MKKKTRLKIQESVLVSFIKVLIFILRRISLKTARRLARLFGNLAYILLAHHRGIVLSNMKLVYEDKKDIKELKRIARENFCFASKIAIETGHAGACGSLDGILDDITIEGKEYLDEALKRGKGVIGLCAHLGNFCITGSFLNSLGYSNTSIMRQIRMKRVEEIISDVRRKIGQDWIYKIPTIKATQESLRWINDGKLLNMYIDQRSSRGVKVPFLGISCFTPTGPAVFTLKSDATVLPMFMIPKGESYNLVIGEPVETKRTGDFKKDVLVDTERFNQVVGKYILKYPEYWFWFHRRWRMES